MNTIVRATNLSLRRSSMRTVKGKRVIVFNRLRMLGNSPKIKHKQYHYEPKVVRMFMNIKDPTAKPVKRGIRPIVRDKKK